MRQSQQNQPYQASSVLLGLWICRTLAFVSPRLNEKKGNVDKYLLVSTRQIVFLRKLQMFLTFKQIGDQLVDYVLHHSVGFQVHQWLCFVYLQRTLRAILTALQIFDDARFADCNEIRNVKTELSKLRCGTTQTHIIASSFLHCGLNVQTYRCASTP